MCSDSLLIEPIGIEIGLKLIGQNTGRLLIEPIGIEIRSLQPIGSLHPSFNWTYWNWNKVYCHWLPTTCWLLIEPIGIEIRIQSASRYAILLLIEPIGIEIFILDKRIRTGTSFNWTYWNWNIPRKNCKDIKRTLLIEPIGIEI